MKIIRSAKTSDKKAFRQLWDIAFTDSIEFRNWFFENRYVPEFSACIEEDGKLVSVVQSIPYFIKIRDTLVLSTMMVGACTHPDYKKRGYMKELYTWYMNYMNSMDVSVCAHTPAVLKTYFYVGHLPVSNTGFLEIEKSSGQTENVCENINILTESAGLLKCYNQFAKNYSGLIARTLTDMRLKCADYNADGGKGICYIKNDEIVSYGIYYEGEEILHGEEIISTKPEYEQIIVNALVSIAKGKKVKIKLPPNTKSSVLDGKLTVGPRNVQGLCNVSALLKAVGKNLNFSIEVFDHVVENNNGIYNFKGEVTNEKPVFKISAGNLIQWIVGYKTLKTIADEGLVEVYNQSSFNELNEIFEIQTCYIIDEY